jgi:protein-disulfide isomerase
MQLRNSVTSQDHSQGPDDAPVTLVEYGDYQCPHCGRAHPVVKRLQQHFGRSLRFVFRNFPLNEMHPMAEPAAETAEFAATHGKFWAIHDAIFEHQNELSIDLLGKLARQDGLDAEALDSALSSGQFRERVRNDFKGGVRSGVNGTPTFFINGQRHDGGFDYESLSNAITHLIS